MIDDIELTLAEMGKPAAFIHGWLDGEFDGIYDSTKWQSSSLSLSHYRAGFHLGQQAAVEGRENVLPKVHSGQR